MQTGKAIQNTTFLVCKTFIPQFKSGWRLFPESLIASGLGIFIFQNTLAKTVDFINF
jgi:hypothetical protein